MEKTNAVFAAQLTQKTPHRNEMIIMHPDRIGGTQQLLELAGKEFVHPEIGGGVAFR
jgi:hypothetical protein